MSIPTSPKVLLVSIYYAPELTGIGINNIAMARAISESGYDVEVVTGMPHFPEWRVHEPYQGKSRMTEIIEGVSVHRFAHFVPRRHWAGSRALYEASFMASASRHKLDGRPDAVISVVPPLSSGFLARRYASRSRAPWGVIFSDLSGRAALQSGMPGGKSVARLVSTFELGLARSANAVGVIADGFIPYLEEGGVPRGRIHRIVNTNRVEAQGELIDRAEMRHRLGWKDTEFVVLHTGNIGYKQALETMIQAAAAIAPDPRILFILMGDGNQREHLQNLARRHSLRNVRFVPPADSAAYPSVLAAADVLLVHQRASVTDMSLPGKISNYFASGTPVIAAVAEKSVTHAEFLKSGGALVVAPEDPKALMTAIRNLFDDVALRVGLSAQARAFELTRRESASAFGVSQFLRAVLGGTDGTTPSPIG